MIKTNTTDRADRVRELQSQLEQQIAELVSGDDWVRMLQTASRFHRYSANNVMLIMLQAPEAPGLPASRRGSRSADMSARVSTASGSWRRASTRVDGTTRMATNRPRVLSAASPSLPSSTSPRLTAQSYLTCGRNCSRAQRRPACGDGLAKQVAAAGFMLARGECGGANGVTDYGARTVTVRADVDDAQACKTLAHELGHILCGHEGELFGGCRGRKEVEAESVAYIVCASAGMATASYTLPYVAGWSGGEVSKVRETAEKVVRVAGAILEALESIET